VKLSIIACRIRIRMFYKDNEQFKKELGVDDESRNSFRKPEHF